MSVFVQFRLFRHPVDNLGIGRAYSMHTARRTHTVKLDAALAMPFYGKVDEKKRYIRVINEEE